MLFWILNFLKFLRIFLLHIKSTILFIERMLKRRFVDNEKKFSIKLR